MRGIVDIQKYNGVDCTGKRGSSLYQNGKGQTWNFTWVQLFKSSFLYMLLTINSIAHFLIFLNRWGVIIHLSHSSWWCSLVHHNGWDPSRIFHWRIQGWLYHYPLWKQLFPQIRRAMCEIADSHNWGLCSHLCRGASSSSVYIELIRSGWGQFSIFAMVSRPCGLSMQMNITSLFLPLLLFETQVLWTRLYGMI